MAILTMFRHRFYKNDGTVNSGGKVYTYTAGTTTPTPTYTDSGAGTANANPIILDSKGEADIWVSGLIKVNVLESDDTQVTGFPVDNIGAASGGSTTANATWAGTASGTANALTLTPSTAISAYAIGQSFIFKAGASANTSTTTISISGLSAIAVQSNGAACAGGEILANNFYMGVLDTLTTFQITKVGKVTLAELGLGTGVATALAIAVGSAGAFVTNGGALGTPSSGNLGSCTAYPSSALAGVPLTAAATGFSATGGTTPKTLTVDDDLTTSQAARRNADNILSGTQTMSGKSIIEANASVAAHATTMNPWLGGNYVTLTGGAVTFTDMAAAPQAGACVELYMNAAHVFTDGAVFEVDGNTNYTAAIGDRVEIRAKSTTVFTVHPKKADGTAVVTAGAGVGDHEVVVTTGNGYGSTNTKIRRFTTTQSSTGTAITYADSAANGGSFTINETGIYAMYYNEADAAGINPFGISVNSTQLTTNIFSITDANRLAISNTNGTEPIAFSRVALLTANDVIRAHTNGTGLSDAGAARCTFAIRKIGVV